MTDESLRPCPFCGGPAELGERHPHGDDPDAPDYWSAQCKGECSNVFIDPAAAVAAWNRRAEPAPEPAYVAKICGDALREHERAEGAEKERDALYARVDRLEEERDTAITVSLVYDERCGWYVGNEHCFLKHHAQRLAAIRRYLDDEDRPPKSRKAAGLEP